MDGGIFLIGLGWVLDSWVREMLNPLGSPGLTTLMRFFSEIGLGVYQGGLGLVLWGIGSYIRKETLASTGRLAFLAVLVSGLGAQGIKHLVGRPRPPLVDEGISHWGPTLAPGLDAFPSGHAATAFAMARILGWGVPGLRWGFYLVAVSIAFSRLYLDRHFFSDVLAGTFLGLWVAGWLLRRYQEKSLSASHRTSDRSGALT